MLNDFDWIRLARSGTELLATLRCLYEEIGFSSEDDTQLGPPMIGLTGPCSRCWIYTREFGKSHCIYCQAILSYRSWFDVNMRNMVVLWCYFDNVPEYLSEKKPSYPDDPYEIYLHGSQRLLLMVKKNKLKDFLQELSIHYGSNIRGLIQIFPTVGTTRITMGDLLCRAVHHEANFPMDLLRIRFYPDPFQLSMPHLRDSKGMLTFSISEFNDMLEMATVFKTLLNRDQQEELYEILLKIDVKEQGFFWGRFLGQINMRAKDMIASWGIRQWSINKVKLLYELSDYVAFYKSC